jgi:hypothetical protein
MRQQNKKSKPNLRLFLKVVPYLNKIGKPTILKLAIRFNTTPQRIVKLIKKETEGGGKYEY